MYSKHNSCLRILNCCLEGGYRYRDYVTAKISIVDGITGPNIYLVYTIYLSSFYLMKVQVGAICTYIYRYIVICVGNT